MTIAFPCEGCGHRFEVDAGFAGKKCKCKKCGHVFVIPVPRRPSGAGPAPAPPKARPSRPAAPAPAPAPAPALNGYDPYGFDDVPEALPMPASVPEAHEDEEFLPPRGPKPIPVKAKTRSRDDDLSFLAKAPWLIVQVGGGLVALLLVFSLFNPSVGLLLALGAYVLTCLSLMILGGLGTIVVPFQESALCGLMNLFLPIYPLYYLITRWDAMKRWFLTYLAGTAMLVVGSIVCALLIPAVSAARHAAERARQRDQLAANGGGQAAPTVTAPRFAAPPNVAPPRFAAPPNVAPPVMAPPGIAPPAVAPPVAPFRNFAPGGRVRDRLAANGGRMGPGGPPPFAPPPFVAPPGPAGPPAAGVQVAEGKAPRAAAEPPPSEEDRPPDGDFVGQVISDLKSPNLRRRKDALRRLKDAPADESRRAEVSRLVEPLLGDPDGFARADAARALAVWGGKENTPALVQALRDPAFNVRGAVLDAIAAIKDPDAAEPVAVLLVNERGKASEALKAIGPKAEPAVVKYLTHGDVFVRMEACKILQVIGTKQSAPALMALLRRTNGFGLDAMAAREALQFLGPANAKGKKSAGRR